jgi:sugar O-acyltransferase (sialic acid O-acetyltransferase NeuD family)
MQYHIIGKSNNLISLLLDSLFELHKSPFEVTIVKNIPVPDHPLFKLENIKSIIISSINDLEWEGKFQRLLMGVIRVPTKLAVYNSFYNSHKIKTTDFHTIIHPSSIISIQSIIGNGVFIGPGTIIAPYVEIGDLVTINRQVSIGHHTSIGKFTTLNPGCKLAGGSVVGSDTTIGMGANIFNDINIGSNSIIGAGSLVTKDIPDNVLAYGIPAKIIKEID